MEDEKLKTGYKIIIFFKNIFIYSNVKTNIFKNSFLNALTIIRVRIIINLLITISNCIGIIPSSTSLVHPDAI